MLDTPPLHTCLAGPSNQESSALVPNRSQRPLDTSSQPQSKNHLDAKPKSEQPRWGPLHRRTDGAFAFTSAIGQLKAGFPVVGWATTFHRSEFRGARMLQQSIFPLLGVRIHQEAGRWRRGGAERWRRGGAEESDRTERKRRSFHLPERRGRDEAEGEKLL